MDAREAFDKGNRSGPIHIVVAKHTNLLSTNDGFGEPLGSAGHVLEAGWVRQQCLQRGIEKPFDGLKFGASRGQHPPQQVRQPMRLRDGGGNMKACRV